MKNRHMLPTLTLALCLTATGMAQADAPASQFGFKGWPYRQTTSCETASTCAPTCTPVAAAPTPTFVPTTAPESTPTSAPTVQPTATTAPTLRPTATAVPTLRPTATPRPTQTPAATAKPTATPPSTGGDYTTGSIHTQEENAYRLLNEDRASNGRAALALDAALCDLARLKSEDMNANGYFAHTSPTLGSAAQMLRDHGYSFTAVGENIAHHATVLKAQAAFMSSAGHRTNILGSQWTRVGVGIAFDRNGYIYETQLFVR